MTKRKGIIIDQQTKERKKKKKKSKHCPLSPLLVMLMVIASVIRYTDGRIARLIMRISKSQRRQGPKGHFVLQFEFAPMDGLLEIPPVSKLGLFRFKDLLVTGLFLLVLLLELCEAFCVLVHEIVQFVVHAFRGLEQPSLLPLAQHFDLGLVQLVHGPVVVVFLRQLCFLLLRVLPRLGVGVDSTGTARGRWRAACIKVSLHVLYACACVLFRSFEFSLLFHFHCQLAFLHA